MWIPLTLPTTTNLDDSDSQFIHRIKQSMESQVRVFVRPKPHCSIDKILSVVSPETPEASTSTSTQQIKLVGEEAVKEYEFDGVFDAECSQQDVFDRCAKSVVKDALHGFNSIVCAYGQSGSGKTHTMVGKPEPEHQGLIPRIAEALFHGNVDAPGVEAKSSDRAMKPRVSMYLFEVYKEIIYDLIDHRTEPLRRSDVRHVFTHCTNMLIDSMDGFYEEFQRCFELRKVASTNWNEESSRSHAICVLEVEHKDTCGRIFCVDLSGSENVKESGAEGTVLKESQAINLSLFYLAEVVRAYDAKKLPSSYRNSVLTMLLKDAFGGNAKVTFIVTVREMLSETKRTLEFAQSLRRIRNKVHINLNFSLEQWRGKCIEAEATIETLRKQVRALEAETEMLRDVLRRNNIALPQLLSVPSLRSSTSSSSSSKSDAYGSVRSTRSDATLPIFVDTFTDPSASSSSASQSAEDAIAVTQLSSDLFESRFQRRRFRTRLSKTLEEIDLLNRRVKALESK